MAAGRFLSGVMAFAEGFPSMKADIFMRKRFCLSFHGKSPISIHEGSSSPKRSCLPVSTPARGVAIWHSVGWAVYFVNGRLAMPP